MSDALHLAFHATQALIHRALSHPATKVAKFTPDSNLRQAFSFALKEFKSFTTFMACLKMEELEGFWGRRKLTLTLCTHVYATLTKGRLTLSFDSLWKLSYLSISSSIRSPRH